MNKRRNIYRGINRRKNKISKVISLGLIVILLSGGSFFIKKYDVNLPKKIISLNNLPKKLSLKGFSYKNLITRVDSPKPEKNYKPKEKEVLKNKDIESETAKLATVKDWGIYSVQVLSTNNEDELKKMKMKLEELKVPFSVLEIDKVQKVHTYTTFSKDEAIKKLDSVKEHFPDAFVSKIEIPMLSLQYTKKYEYVESICTELNNLISNFEEEAKLWDKGGMNIDKENYKNIIKNRKYILTNISDKAKDIDYKGMEVFKDNLLNYVNTVKDKSYNGEEMLEKNQANISESLFIASMQGYYVFINSIKSI